MADVLSPSEFELTIDNENRRHLNDTARWGRFLAIAGLIMSIFALVGGLAIAFKEPENQFYLSEAEKAGRRVGVIAMSLIFCTLYIIPSLMLLKYCTKLKSALMTDNKEDLTTAFRAQKNLYIYMGVLTIIMLAFVAIGLLAQLGE